MKSTRRMSLLITLGVLSALFTVNLLLQPDEGPGMGESEANRALTLALEKRDISAMRCAIARGAELNIVDSSGWSPLTRAVVVGDSAICNELLERGANPNGGSQDCLVDDDQQDIPPIVCAAVHGRKEILELLIHHGSDINARTCGGSTAVNIAAALGEQSVVAALVHAGADVNVADAHGWTPLMGAAQGNTSEMVEILLAAGARVDITDEEGDTALEVASRGGNYAVVSMLRHRSGDGSTLHRNHLLGMSMPDPSLTRHHS